MTAPSDSADKATKAERAARGRLPEQVTSPRLVLRRLQHADTGELQVLVTANIEHLRPFMSWIKQEPMTLTERVGLIERWTREWEDGDGVILGAFLDGVAIGVIGVHRRVGAGALEIGYWIDQDHVGRGYATEATAALTTAAFELGDIERVQVHTDEANQASCAIPEKLGFRVARIETREPQAPGESGQLIIWTTTPATWPANGTNA